MSTKNETDRAFDVRILERNVRRGAITRKDVEKYLKSLPDRGDNVARTAEESDGGSHGSNGVRPSGSHG
jgi:hypothetical protein